MKKLLALALFALSVGQCRATKLEIKLSVVDSSNIQKFASFKDAVFSASYKDVQPSDLEKAAQTQEKVWQEVTTGERNLLLACFVIDDASVETGKYLGHIFFIVQDDGRIRIGVPGIADRSDGNTKSMLTLFLNYLQNLDGMKHEIIFSLPGSVVSSYQLLITYFQFVESPSVALENSVEKAMSYGFNQKEAEQFRWFLLHTDVDLLALD